ncbi:restriction endonuclease subunit S [Shewanella algae]|uniref:restriction endonuclease subunit S n=1 Tax=Shewanella algae TaxID=38313 RepID=UPI000D11DF5D|nr:restriction endonuclease subunit S [Shewanella algae]MBO2584171.1 restriction endonuclease subunit S [Shewanella algae]PSS70484.1 hypothetical protein AYI85_07800 [Shewanella algae]TVL04854.1 hypothetical protein AYI84_06920 [Shewanella algae]TVL52178.1 hypothetical protein AYI99_00130 [Shewanella algae]TWO84839.1 hypothetical protein AYI75_06930 [Shewanella algae]
MSDLAPEGWRLFKLNEVVEPRSSNVDKKSYTGDRAVRLCNYTDVYYNNRITRHIAFMEATAKDKEIERFSLEFDDVIITKDSETPDDIAIPSYVSETLHGVVCGYHLTLLRPYKDKVSGEYLAHLLQLPDTQHYFYILANGITRFGLTADAIASAPIVLPPLLEQQKIAKILTSVDEVIEKTQAQIDKLKDLKTGMMQELLTQGVGVDGKPHTEFKDSPVGRIPKAWEVKCLGEIFPKIVVGYVGNVNDYYCDSGEGVPFYRTLNIRDGYIRHEPIKYVTRAFNDKNKKSQISNDDILIARVGANLGMTCKVTGLSTPANIANAIIIKAKKGISSGFFSEFIRSQLGQAQIQLGAAGGAQGVFNTGLAQGLIVPVPSHEEQKNIEAVLKSIDEKINKVQLYLERKVNLKKGLMQDLLTGKVRVAID